MALTFAQMEQQEISRAKAVSAVEAVTALAQDPDILLVDVRDTAEMEATGIGSKSIQAPGRAVAWMADLESEYRCSDLQDRSRRVFTTCGGAPSFRGAAAANVLTSMGFSDVSFVDGGMAALIAEGLPLEKP
ncbi:MAG: rhodanese-like domain-containing protein [Ruegeria sp.]